MNGHHFDDLARQLARRATRRAIVRWLGLGGVAVPFAGQLEKALAQDVDVDPAVAQKAADLEYDVTAIFRFVADEIQYDPYLGNLRGARGTLDSRAGNSVDQALLLAALLQAGGIAVRFAIGALDDAASANLLATSQIDAATYQHQNNLLWFPSTQPESGTPTAATPAATSTPVVADPLDFWLKTTRAINDQVRDTIATIESSLHDSGITLPDPAPALPASEKAKHVWVQYASGPEWVDLDPTLPNAQPGQRWSKATSTVPALPSDLDHIVTVRLVLETIAGGQLIEAELLSHQATSAELTGQKLLVIHPTPDSLKGVGLAISGVIEGALNYQPYLLLDDDFVEGRMVTFGAGGGVLDSNTTSDAQKHEGEPTAEWLEIILTAPDGATTTTRREIFDRIGPAERVNGSFNPATLPALPLSNLPQDEGSRGYLPMLGMHGLAITTGGVPVDTFQVELTEETFYASLPLLAASHSAIRDAAAAIVLPPYGVRPVTTAPNVTAFVAIPLELNDSGGTLSVRYDLVHQAVEPVPLRGGRSSSNPRVALGVLNQVVERALLDPPVAPNGSLPPIEAISLGRIFEMAKASNVPIQVVRPDEPIPSALRVNADATAHMSEALKAGQIIVVPSQPIDVTGEGRIGWWQIDPSSGRTTDLMDNGHAAVERSFLSRAIAYIGSLGLKRLAACLASAVVFAAACLLGSASHSASVARAPSYTVKGYMAGSFTAFATFLGTSAICAGAG